MQFVFFQFQRTEKMDSVMKGLLGQCHPQNFWARTAPAQATLPNRAQRVFWCSHRRSQGHKVQGEGQDSEDKGRAKASGGIASQLPRSRTWALRPRSKNWL